MVLKIFGEASKCRRVYLANVQQWRRLGSTDGVFAASRWVYNDNSCVECETKRDDVASWETSHGEASSRGVKKTEKPYQKAKQSVKMGGIVLEK